MTRGCRRSAGGFPTASTRRRAPRPGWASIVAGRTPWPAATPYLKLMGDVIGGWLLAKGALAAARSENSYGAARIAIAGHFADTLLAEARRAGSRLSPPAPRGCKAWAKRR